MYYSVPSYCTEDLTCHTTEAPKYCTTSYVDPAYTTKASEYYTTKAPAHYTEAPVFYNTTYAAPEYYTDVLKYYTTKAAEYYTSNYDSVIFYNEVPYY
jgi:hypothetical protein